MTPYFRSGRAGPGRWAWLLVGTIGPKTVRSAAHWADGLAGTTLDLDVDKQRELFDVATTSWAEGRQEATASGDLVLVRPRRSESPPVRRSTSTFAGT